ncbi:hypothetical protein A5707_11120 [Mycobacterium kyorinense]|uniref:Uncharacterized protein n=1 Tax=Mycobacterium kyorinense TaxID=487514 RepID=A0A1A2ZXK1_9MYCO|nr:hypothetical protein [Mycobacterium kyorinense]OBI53796.1 hypothetical protein A5707_11120 [Mycobacterium kyorinense]
MTMQSAERDEEEPGGSSRSDSPPLRSAERDEEEPGGSGRSDSPPLLAGNPNRMRAEEGDETVKGLADEAEKTKKELRDSTTTGKKAQEQSDESE